MVVEVKIDYEKCTSCEACVTACSYNVLEWLDDMPIVVNAANCTVCLECEKNCPVSAISVKEK